MLVYEREVTPQEQEALQKYLFINEFSNIAVVALDTLSRLGQYVVQVPESGDWPDDNNGWGGIIVCQLLWLARQDAKVALATGADEVLRTDMDPGAIKYDEFEYPDKIHVLGDQDAFVANHLTKLRDDSTKTGRYRDHSHRVSERLFTLATADLGIRYERVTTGTGIEMMAPRLDERVVIIEIPRAARPMTDAAIDLLPHSDVGVIGLQRDEEDPESKAVKYYSKLPKIDDKTVVVIADPMLATGGSMVDAISEVAKHDPKGIKVVCQIAAPEGIRRLQSEYPDVEIWVGELDSHLNEANYIIPGLGDAGDRYFGTN